MEPGSAKPSVVKRALPRRMGGDVSRESAEAEKGKHNLAIA